MIRKKPAVEKDWSYMLLGRAKNTTNASMQVLLQQRYPAHQQKNGNNLIAMSHHISLTEDRTDISQPSEHPDQNKKSSSVSEAADLTGHVLLPKTCSGSGGGSSVCGLVQVSRPSSLL